MATETAVELMAAEYTRRADQAMAGGQHREAAGLLWKAVRSTFIGLARERGLRCDGDLIDLAKALEAEGTVGKGYYRSGLGAGQYLRDHAELGVLSAAAARDAYETVREFIVEQHGEF